MSLRPATMSRLLPCAAAAALLVAGVSRGQSAATQGEPAQAAGDLTVPPVPDGTPAELMEFVQGLLPPKAQPRSREEMMRYMQGVMVVSVQVADKILAQVQPDDPVAAEAAKLKLEGLTMLARMGDEQAAEALTAYAATLIESPNPELAKEAKRMLFASEAQAMFSSGNLDAGPALIEKMAEMVAADPDDVQTAGLASQFTGLFESVPGGESLSIKACESLSPLFAKSANPQVRKLGERFAATLRRLSLPGKPMEIQGTLIDGTPFDPKSIAGKVVLVDFWATDCPPCRAEIPNIKKAYEKYRDQGFEVVGISLDDDGEVLKEFVQNEEIPWPILHDNPETGGGNPLARHYGITTIPHLILIGRDGNVITLNARGPRLAEELEKLFKDAG